MDEKPANVWLKIAPAYADFSVKFFRNPAQAFSASAKSGEVSKDLFAIFVGGVALSYVIVLVAAPPSLKTDSSILVRWSISLDWYLLPVAAFIAVFLIALIGHIGAKSFFATRKLFDRAPIRWWDPWLGGAAEDSVNAAMGVAAVFVPLFAATLCAVSWFPPSTWLPGTAGMVFAALFLIYMPWSLSCTHPNTGVTQAFLALGASFFMVFIVASGVESLWNALSNFSLQRTR